MPQQSQGLDPAKSGGPYIQAAAFCEYVLEEKDKTLSLIRIIDTVTQSMQITSGEPPKEFPPLACRLKLVLMFKSGEAMGSHQLKVTPILPTGETKAPFVQTLYFEGDEKGANLVLDFGFTFTYEGLYWFDIHINDLLATRLPLRLKREFSVLPSR